MNIFTSGRFIELVYKTTLCYFVFWLSFFSVSYAQDMLENSANFKKLFNQENYVVLAETHVIVDIVDSKSERAKGLSGRTSLKPDAGMFFIFDTVGKHGIWMKEMKFPIDIVWIDQNMEVVYIENDVSPDTYPKTFAPTSPARYVLELNAGFVKKYGIKVGDQATLF